MERKRAHICLNRNILDPDLCITMKLTYDLLQHEARGLQEIAGQRQVSDAESQTEHVVQVNGIRCREQAHDALQEIEVQLQRVQIQLQKVDEQIARIQLERISTLKEQEEALAQEREAGRQRQEAWRQKMEAHRQKRVVNRKLQRIFRQQAIERRQERLARQHERMVQLAAMKEEQRAPKKYFHFR